MLLGKLETVYRRSVDERRFSTAVRAVELQARLSGFARRGRGEGGEVASKRSPTSPSGVTGWRDGVAPGDVTVLCPRPRPVNDN